MPFLSIILTVTLDHSVRLVGILICVKVGKSHHFTGIIVMRNPRSKSIFSLLFATEYMISDDAELIFA